MSFKFSIFSFSRYYNYVLQCICYFVYTALDYNVTGLPALANLTRLNDEQCYNVTIIDDTLLEPNEHLLIEFNITGGSDITVMVDNQTEITILDNDGGVIDYL